MGLTGAILGDIIGSRFEFEKEIPEWNACEFFHKSCVFTDDTIQSLAIGLAEISDQKYSLHLYNLCNKYLFVGYGGNFHRWLAEPNNAPNNSWGNGSAMRVSVLGEMATSLSEAELKAENSAKCTHNSSEAIKGAKAIAGCVYMAKMGCTKTEILKYAQNLYPQDTCEYYVGRKLSEYRTEYKFEVSCNNSVPVAIQCFLESDTFQSCMRNVLYINGDTDTLGAMAGAIAESFYKETGFNNKQIIKKYLDVELYDVWERIEHHINCL